MSLFEQTPGSGNSTNDEITYIDGMGRTRLVQDRESPTSNNWDTVETDYDQLGRIVRSTLPFVSTLGVGSTTAPGETFQYDAIGRMTQQTNSDTPPG